MPMCRRLWLHSPQRRSPLPSQPSPAAATGHLPSSTPRRFPPRLPRGARGTPSSSPSNRLPRWVQCRGDQVFQYSQCVWGELAGVYTDRQGARWTVGTQGRCRVSILAMPNTHAMGQDRLLQRPTGLGSCHISASVAFDTNMSATWHLEPCRDHTPRTPLTTHARPTSCGQHWLKSLRMCTGHPVEPKSLWTSARAAAEPWRVHPAQSASWSFVLVLEAKAQPGGISCLEG